MSYRREVRAVRYDASVQTVAGLLTLVIQEPLDGIVRLYTLDEETRDRLHRSTSTPLGETPPAEAP